MNVYLDNNTTTMVDSRIYQAIKPFFIEKYADPNTSHTFAYQTHPAIEEAMKKIYEGIGADTEDLLIITSSATESNNWVLKSIFFEYILTGKKNHIIVSKVEHPSVLFAAKWIESMGCKVSYLPIENDGIVNLQTLKETITDKTALVSIMWANHHTGAIFPIKEIGDICKERNVLFHTDATQAIGKLPVNIQNFHIDYLTFSAHTFHGPKGIGALYIKKGRELLPLFHGEKQMNGYRSGTLNTAGIIGMSIALETSLSALKFEMKEVRKLRDMLEDELLKIEDTYILTPKEKRVPNTVFISFKSISNTSLLWDLSKAGIAASIATIPLLNNTDENPDIFTLDSKENPEINLVKKNIITTKELTHTAISFSLSRYTSKKEINYTLDIVKKAVNRLRKISSSYH